MGGQSRRSQSGEDLFEFIYTNLQSSHIDAYDADTDEEEQSKDHEVVENLKSIDPKEDPNGHDHAGVSDSPSVSSCNDAKNGNDQVAPQLKNGGFFAALDKMERGELETQEKKNLDNRECKETTPPTPTSMTPNSSQSKVTDFFKCK